MAHIEDILLWAVSRKGIKYVFGAEADGKPDPRAIDCSELVQWSCQQAGMTHVPDGAVNQYGWVHETGTEITVDQALRTRGALMFPYPKVHHVVFSLGDGTTMEAKGAAYGVGVFSAKGRFQRAGLIPGVDYSPRLPLRPAPSPEFVSELTLPDNSGGWRLKADGGVFTWGRAPFWGSYPGLPAKDRQGSRTFVKITTVGDAKPGYVLVSSAGERYTFRPKAA